MYPGSDSAGSCANNAVLSSSATLSTPRRDEISANPDMAVLTVAQRHYLSSLLFDAQFGSQLRRKITNVIYNRRPTRRQPAENA